MESAEVGNIGLKQLREQREITTNRWEKIGLLEGLEGNVKENCAQLFENQLSHMINESSDSSNSGQFETVAFPVIRRVFAKLNFLTQIPLLIDTAKQSIESPVPIMTIDSKSINRFYELNAILNNKVGVKGCWEKSQLVQSLQWKNCLIL